MILSHAPQPSSDTAPFLLLHGLVVVGGGEGTEQCLETFYVVTTGLWVVVVVYYFCHLMGRDKGCC